MPFKMQYRDIDRNNQWADWSSMRFDNEPKAREFMRGAEIASNRDGLPFVYRVVTADLMKISEWLSTSIGSHDIASASELFASFKLQTGQEPTNWPLHSKQQTKRAMDARGLGGQERPGDGADVWGYELAQHLAYVHANGFRSPAMGRGTIFNHCVEALKVAGH